MSLPRPIIIKRAPTSNINLAITDFKGDRRLDIREYRQLDGEEFKPTKHGVTIPLHAIDEVIAGLTKLKAAMPNKVVEITNDTRWVIVKNREEAEFHKKHVYASLSEAQEANPPDGYSIFKVQVKDGTVVKTRRESRRVDGAWVDVE